MRGFAGHRWAAATVALVVVVGTNVPWPGVARDEHETHVHQTAPRPIACAPSGLA